MSGAGLSPLAQPLQGRRLRQMALARNFPAELCLPLDAALALYRGMAVKTPGLTLQPKSRTPVYSGQVADILAGQSAFTASGYSMRSDSLDAVAGFIRDAGITRVLEFGPGVSSLVLPRLFQGQIERYLCIEEDADYAAGLIAAFGAHPAYQVVAMQRLELSEEAGPIVTREDTPPFRAATFQGLRQTLKSAFGARPPELILIDGPSGRARWGRFAALADIADLLAPGAIFLLDDALRHREVAILDEWRSRGLVEMEGIFCLGTGLAVGRIL